MRCRKVIIANAITPRFKAGDFGGGISRGVDDIITVLTTDASEWQKRPALRLDSRARPTDPTGWIVAGLIVVVVILLHRFAGLPLVLLQRRAEYPAQLGQVSAAAAGLRRWRRRRILRRRRFVGRRRRVGELVMEHFGRRSRAHLRRPSAPPRPGPRARSSACWREVVGRRHGAADSARRGRRAGAALAAGRVHRAAGASASCRCRLLAFVALAIARSACRRVRVALMPRAARRAVAHRAAMEQFRIRGIARKKDRTGILIFVSLAERYARIVADDGIAARVPQAHGRRRRRRPDRAYARRPHRRRLRRGDRRVRQRARDALSAQARRAATNCRTGFI